MSDKRLKRYGLERVEIPPEQSDAVMSRIETRIQYTLDQPYLLNEIEHSIISLAQDCYTQGLLDGAQVAARIANGSA